jgi:hypothetical protein
MELVDYRPGVTLERKIGQKLHINNMVKKFELICNEIKDCTVSTQDWDWVLQD